VEPGAPAGSLSADAKVDTAQALFEDLSTVRDPSDGGGRAWLIELLAAPSDAAAERATPATSVRVASPARVRIGYEIGPLGIAEGGMLMLQSSPFWGWQPAQNRIAEAGGYTTATTDAPGVSLEPDTFAGGLAGFTVRGRALRAGEEVELVYGAGPSFAWVDRYAEAEARIWIHVDGDGDGVRSPVASSPTIRVHAAAAERLVIKPPTTAQPGERIEIRLALLDAAGNSGVRFEGEIVLSAAAGLELPQSVRLTAEDRGVARLNARPTAAGVYRILAEARPTAATSPGDEAGAPPLRALSGPLVVRKGAARVLWADLHGHSSLSDGTGTPGDFYRYARDVGGLDVAALTDHDHWGMRPLDSNPDMWERIQGAVASAHEPGRFVALLGYEWTSWLHGHRHVLHFADRGPLFSSIDLERRWETPAQLWDALRGLPALTFAHHSAGGPVSTNWNYAPDPVLEPVTEIVSVHGSSEAPDSPRRIYDPVPGNYVRDALDRGFAFGFIGSGDSHDGHPGLAHIASPGSNNGLAAIFAPELTREAVLEALRARHSYATNGPRIWLRTNLDGRVMGSEVAPPVDGAPHRLTIQVATEGPLERVDVISDGEIVAALAGDGDREWSTTLEVEPLGPGSYLYVRVVQENGGAAWSSPYFGKRGRAPLPGP
jgi:hypothetical protein